MSFIFTQLNPTGDSHKSELAQRKRVGPITQRSHDRNVCSLSEFFFALYVRARYVRVDWHRLEVYFGSGCSYECCLGVSLSQVYLFHHLQVLFFFFFTVAVVALIKSSNATRLVAAEFPVVSFIGGT